MARELVLLNSPTASSTYNYTPYSCTRTSILNKSTLVITGKVITLEMGPGYQKAKNTIGPDLKSFLGMRLSGLNSNIDHQFPGNFWIITKQSKMIQLAGCAAVRVLQFPSCLMSLTNEFYRYPTAVQIQLYSNSVPYI